MTKYEEVDANQVIEEGDRITFTGPLDGEVTVRVVKSTKDSYNSGLVIQSVPGYLVRLNEITKDASLKITKIERPVPEVGLPTKPGYYESAKFPVSDGRTAYRLTSNGEWLCDVQRMHPSAMLTLMPLTLLVPEANVVPEKLADRLDPHKAGIWIEGFTAYESDDYTGDGAALIAAIENGQLDK